MSTQQHNSDFLLGLLLEENKHLNVIDFINRSDKATYYACVCVSMALMQSYEQIKQTFKNSDQFIMKYMEIYANALENYHSIVSGTIRQILVDETKIFYPLNLAITTTNQLVTNNINKAIALQILDSIKNSCAIILRDEIAFVIIHYENDDYIIIDPHVEYCGILSKNSVYKYITYNGIWNFGVNFLIQPMAINNSQPTEIIVQADKTIMQANEAIMEADKTIMEANETIMEANETIIEANKTIIEANKTIQESGNNDVVIMQ